MTNPLENTLNTLGQAAASETKVIYQKAPSPILGIFSILFGLISIFILSILFVPLGLLFGVLSLLKREKTRIILGAIGIVLSLIGLFTSPMLLGLLGLSILF